MLEVKRDVQQRMAAAMSLVDGVLLLAEEAVLECEQRELVTEDYKFGCHRVLQAIKDADELDVHITW